MKKIFAVYGKVLLAIQPDWLNDFRSKYDKPYDFHITLKQSANIDPDHLDTIKTIIKKILKNAAIPNHVLRLHFDELIVDQDEYDKSGYIYLFSKKRNKPLDLLQYEIRTQLNQFSDYLNPSSKDYEHNFSPHITIAREMDASTLRSAQSELKDDFDCRGEVREVVLSCLDEITPEESTNPAKLTVFKF